ITAGGLDRGQELAQAQALWAAALRDAPRLRTPFDQGWFASLLTERTTPGETDGEPPRSRVAEQAADSNARRQDWGEAPEVAGFLGRATERALLRQWVSDERCRLVAVLGLGGIGKTLLAARLAHDVAPAFDRVYWRSLRNAPSPGEWLAGALGFLAPDLVPPG